MAGDPGFGTAKPSPGGGRRRRSLATGGAAALLLAAGLAAAPELAVSAASGPSLVARVKTGVDWTTFGRAGEAGAPEHETSSEVPGALLREGFQLTGADLYRLNCRSCHGPLAHGSRSGVPPLAGALAAPGQPVAAGEPGSEIRVRHRLVDGGRVMPPFSHLQADEVELLLGHLRALAGQVPASDRSLRQPAQRVGEHIAKATCQICHDAARGPVRQPADADVVTLGEMTTRFAVGEFVHKVRYGSADVLSTAKGRMPRFEYLAPRELEAVYVYLTAYPPRVEER